MTNTSKVFRQASEIQANSIVWWLRSDRIDKVEGSGRTFKI